MQLKFFSLAMAAFFILCAGNALAICGDGSPDLGEQCDDGNLANGDGCSAICQIEDGFSCTEAIAVPPTPSMCTEKTDQTINGLAANPVSAVVDGSSTLSATASSGLPVTFGSNTVSTCAVAGTNVSYVAVGTCTVTADQAGDDNYNPAPQVTLDIEVTQAIPVPVNGAWYLALLLLLITSAGVIRLRRS